MFICVLSSPVSLRVKSVMARDVSSLRYSFISCILVTVSFFLLVECGV